VAFYLGCIKITPKIVLARSRRNLVVHAERFATRARILATDLARDRGKNTIPVCLLEAADEVDSGSVIYRDRLDFGGHELIDEMRRVLGEKSVELCLRFFS
jgi:hypothetical protein